MPRHAAARSRDRSCGTGWAAGQAPTLPTPLSRRSTPGRTRTPPSPRKSGPPELGFQEERSSAILQATLAEAGFTIVKGVAGMPTAFTASYGRGKPVIAVIGEFDALPGMSQAAGEAVRQPVMAGAPGHGCGHNLLGTASAAAAIAAKEWLARSGRSGTVRYYGTPAEEGGGGKVYMLLDGLFDDVDAASAGILPTPTTRMPPARWRRLPRRSGSADWHPCGRGAGQGPVGARRLEAFDYMLNLMREHVPQETRIHYVIKKGGVASNIVPDLAEGEYQARHPDMRVLRDIWARIVKAAEGAALGTGTTVAHEVTMSYWNVLPNEVLAALQHRNLTKVAASSTPPGSRRLPRRSGPR